MSTHIIKRCRTLALTLLLVGSAANADTISFNNTFGPVAVPLASTPLAPLSLFDPALGTLTEVNLTLDADAFAGSIAWDNEANRGCPKRCDLER